MKRAALPVIWLGGIGAGIWGDATAVSAVAAERFAQPLEPGRDYHSYANVEEFRTTHVTLVLHVDFEHQQLYGDATLDLERLDPDATEIVLDTRDLTILDVTEQSADFVGATEKMAPIMVKRPYRIGKRDPVLGSSLTIDVPPSRAAGEKIHIEYETSPKASGLQWLTPAQTAGKRQPFLFTESESIHARSWIPLQDTPQVRVTYSAHIITPPKMLAVMSASNDPKAKRDGDYLFDMPQAVPSYLIALAVGDLVFKPTGPRTGVYAERPIVAAAAKEFVDTEPMIETCEKLFGPYRWGRYDILVLPPSFPMGGMENPRLTFITPTVIAGDKSLVAVIAHELAHSWSGNLVSNASWRDLWLNEGFTVYLERRILKALYGEKRYGMEDLLGLRSLRKELPKLPPGDQSLAVDLRGRAPDFAFTQVPYEKGRLFLGYLESKFGAARFDEFLRGYFDHFAFQSISTEQFLDYLQAHLLERYPGIVARNTVDQWVNGPGLPADATLPNSPVLDLVDAARDSWLSGAQPLDKLDVHDWVTQQWLQFLNGMPAHLSAGQMAALDTRFAFTASSNAVIENAWLLNAIRNDYRPADKRLEQYLLSIGRTKLIKPLYEALLESPAGTVFAKRVYAAAKPGYHPQTVASLDELFARRDLNRGPS